MNSKVLLFVQSIFRYIMRKQKGILPLFNSKRKISSGRGSLPHGVEVLFQKYYYDQQIK